MTTPPGWYQDPDDPLLDRYWDGESWTEHISQRPTTTVPRNTKDAARQAKADAKAAAQQQKAEAKALQEWQESPVGQATSAYDEGRGFFQVQLTLSAINRIWGGFYGSGGAYNVSRTGTTDYTDVLSQIESVG